MSNTCPYCQQDLYEAACAHWVATLCDDSDGFDTTTPLYFGQPMDFSETQENVIVSLKSYFEALCALCEQIEKKGPGEGKRILREAKDLPPVEKATLTDAINLLDRSDAKEGYESVHDVISGLQRQMKDLFKDFVLRGGGNATNWLIDNAPVAPSWSGTNYYAEDAEKCCASIIEESGNATERLRKLIHER